MYNNYFRFIIYNYDEMIIAFYSEKNLLLYLTSFKVKMFKRWVTF